MDIELLKFKSRQKILKDHYKKSDKSEWAESNVGYRLGVNDSFDSFADRINIYDKYKNDPIKFKEEHEKEFERFMIDILHWSDEKLYYPDEHYIKEDCIDMFNDWLFKLCFNGGSK